MLKTTFFMKKTTRKHLPFLIAPPRQLPPEVRLARLRDRARWLKKVDLLQAFNSLFDFMPEYRVFLKRRPGEIMFLSRAMLQTLHIEDEACLIGMSDYDLTPGPLAEVYYARDELVLRTGRPIVGALEVWFTREGLPQWFTCYKLPLKDRRGKLVGVIGFLKEYPNFVNLPVREPLKSLVAHIQSNLSKKITVQELADMAYLSTRQVQRVFRDVFGVSPKEFITKVRIHQAVHLLTETDMSLKDIALEVGFCDQSALTFYLRREIGVTPLKFRKAAKAWKAQADSPGVWQSGLTAPSSLRKKLLQEGTKPNSGRRKVS